MGDSAEALLVTLMTCSTPARAALLMTFSSCAGTPGLTSTTVVMPATAALMLAGASRSPAAISAPASASAFAFSGLRTSARTGTSRCLSRSTASEPTFPAVVTRIMACCSLRYGLGYATHSGRLRLGCQTQNEVEWRYGERRAAPVQADPQGRADPRPDHRCRRPADLRARCGRHHPRGRQDGGGGQRLAAR